MQTVKLDISSENFDLFFLNQLEQMAPSTKEEIPHDLFIKVFNGHGAVSSDKLAKLSFLARLYYLWKMDFNFFLVVEGKEGGVDHEGFIKLKEFIKKRDYGVERTGEMKCEFVIGSKELCDSYEYLNRLSVSPSFNFLMRANRKKLKPNKTTEHRQQMNFIVRFLAHWEAGKRRWSSDSGVTIPELLVLLYCYHGNEVVGSEMYKRFYKGAYQASSISVRRSFISLQAKGLLKRTGFKGSAKMSITALGVEKVNSLINDYVLKF